MVGQVDVVVGRVDVVGQVAVLTVGVSTKDAQADGHLASTPTTLRLRRSWKGLRPWIVRATFVCSLYLLITC